MREAAMMGKAEHGILEIAEDIDIGSFRGQRRRGRSQGRLAIEAGTAQAGAGQKMSDGFQN